MLPGITRDTVITLAERWAIRSSKRLIPREMLYIADEVFFSGTAAEISPIRSVDRIPVGAGKRGPITEKLQKEFFAIVEGKSPDKFDWLTPVPQPVAVSWCRTGLQGFERRAPAFLCRKGRPTQSVGGRRYN